MRKLNLVLLLALSTALAACNVVPPTVVMMVITTTPDPHVISITVTPPPGTGEATGSAVNPEQATLTPTSADTAAVPVSTQPAGPTQTLSPFPTEVRAQLYIAQQDFEHGYMFWISTKKVIWVLFTSATNPNSGEWRSYPDTFVDGEPEIDPNLKPPSDTLYQPKRGFGKLWRSSDDIKTALGWATTPEFNLNTSYVYQQGGYLDQNNKYVPGPGKHFLTSLSRQTFALSEPPQGSNVGKWERIG